MRRVAILGAGMAGLAAAWRLSDPEHRDHVQVTVYQRDWLLGGKGASSRGPYDRIEEHGLHVWLGYYDNAFRLMREVYDTLDRARTDPACPIRTWRDAFSPVDRLGMLDDSGEGSHWTASFSTHRSEPGLPSQLGGPLQVVDLVTRGLRLLVDLAFSLGTASTDSSPSIVLSSSAWHPRSRHGERDGVALRGLDVAAVLDAADAVRTLARSSVSPADVRAVTEPLSRLAARLATETGSRVGTRRARDLAALVITCVLGAVRDGLLVDPAGFAAIDHLDFRAWLRRHGASPQTAESPLVRAMYDLAFAYENGDPRRPSICAGLGLFLASRLFFDYKGSIVWRMEAGMGEAVVAPLYQALRARGVRFRFFHEVKALHLSPNRDGIAAVSVARSARLAPGVEEYQPLLTVRGLPCFPRRPKRDQLAPRSPADLPEPGHAAGRESLQLRVGVDFDTVVLAVPPPMARRVAHELVEHSPRWREALTRIACVPTQSLQLWLREPASALGWDESCMVATGYAKPFESYAAMSHLIGLEDWPTENPVRAIGYFCSALPSRLAEDPDTAHEAVRTTAAQFLNQDVRRFWPRAVTADGTFRWEVLWSPDGQEGEARLDSQYWRANVDPSDQYVQSLPGTSSCRLQADESGYRNLVLAGDWLNSGLNAGCIEAAVMSGLEAANVVLGRRLTADLLGEWYGLRP